MRIMVLIHEFPPIGGGGGRVAQDIARGLVKRGHEVRVLAPHLKGLDMQSRADGVHLTRVPSFRRKPFIADFLAMSGYLVTGFFASLWLVFRFRPQVIHVHFAVPAGWLAWILYKLTGVPYVLTTHLGDVPGGVPEKTDRWFKWIYPFTPRIWQDAVSVTAISEHTRRLALSHYPVDIKVIPNGIDIGSKHNTDPRLNTPPQIVFAGRFVSQKNPLLFPQILSNLKDLDWHCVMIGDGPLRDETIRQIDLFGLRERFSLPGWVSPEEVIHTLEYSDILLLPSKSEGIPMIGLQSLAAGLAIVASRVGGLIDLVEAGHNGFLHAPGDIQGFVQSLSSLLSDQAALLNFRKTSLYISRRFDLSYIVDEYEKELIKAVKVE